jgi:hypothetical protein
VAESGAPRPIKAAKSDNKRALTMGAIGLGLLLVVFLATHVLAGGGSAKSASATIKASITTATTQPARLATGIALTPRKVTDPGPTPNTARDPFVPLLPPPPPPPSHP